MKDKRLELVTSTIRIAVKNYKMRCFKWRSSGTNLPKENENKANNNDHDEDDDVSLHSNLSDLEKREWQMELREHDLCMEEYNLQLRRQKMKRTEENEARVRHAKEEEIRKKEIQLHIQKKDLEKERLLMEERNSKKRGVEERERDLICKTKSLKEREFKLTEKNAILEIVLKMNDREGKVAVKIGDLQTGEEDQNMKEQIQARENELEEKEEELCLRQHYLDEQEIKIEEKNNILQIAIRFNEYR